VQLNGGRLGARRPGGGFAHRLRLALSGGEQELCDREEVREQEETSHGVRELPPDAKAPPRAGKVMREGPPETASVRAKSSGHGKKTADKWNQ
jgi:hypothetical protein